jgi:hypothetical protein
MVASKVGGGWDASHGGIWPRRRDGDESLWPDFSQTRRRAAQEELDGGVGSWKRHIGGSPATGDGGDSVRSRRGWQQKFPLG